MEKAYYIIFHPERARQRTPVHATVMVSNSILPNWNGDIFVDQIGEGNEDPFVFTDPWLYSYCHASQLRRNVREEEYLQIGSKIIFASGQYADRGILTVDTVFLIGDIQKWGSNPLRLPDKYKRLFNDKNSPLWERHFRFPFDGIHKTVSHTYEAELWDNDKSDFSFLPLAKNGERASIPFGEFSKELRSKIEGQVIGKYPVLLTKGEMNEVVSKIEKSTITKVLKNITSSIVVKSKKKKC